MPHCWRKLRRHLNDHGMLASTVVAGKEADGAKFRDWFDFREAIRSIPSHRALALLRGRNEDVLRLALKTEQELRDPPEASPCVTMVAAISASATRGARRTSGCWKPRAGPGWSSFRCTSSPS
jgi:transcriptional accessory protein Tex/SPT6